MKKVLVFLLLVVLAVVSAALYGFLHDQISYSVSREYYSKFKFVQFGLSGLESEHIAAGVVGVLATWWLGLPLGLMLAGVGFSHKNSTRMLVNTLKSFGVVVVVALLVGLLGLLYGYVQTRSFDLAEYRGWFIPPDLIEPRRFLCAGYMHNSSYLGAVVALPVAIFYQLWLRRNVK
jgi:hypothetical protein